jgi:WD40 repeat protein
MRVLTGVHRGPVYDVRFAGSRGSFVVTGGADGVVGVWNVHRTAGDFGDSAFFASSVAAASNESTRAMCVSRLKEGHVMSVLALDVTAGGESLASGGEDRAVCVWDVEHGSVVRRLFGHRGRHTGVSFAGKGGALLVTCATDGAACVWDLRDRSVRGGLRPLQSLRESKDALSSCVWCESRFRLLTGGLDGFVRAYDVRGGSVQHFSMGEAVHAVSVDPSGSEGLVASCAPVSGGALPSRVRLVDEETGEELEGFEGHSVGRYPSRVRLMGTTVWGSSECGKVFAWDFLDKGVPSRVLEVPGGRVVGALDVNGTQLVAASHDSDCTVFDISSSTAVDGSSASSSSSSSSS